MEAHSAQGVSTQGSRLFIRENQWSVPHGRDSLRKLPNRTRGARTKVGKMTWFIGQVERRELWGQTSCAGVRVPGSRSVEVID